MSEKKIKQELREKTEAVKKILGIKGEGYEEWLLKKQTEYITDNVSFLLDIVSKNEQVQEQKSE